MIELTAEELKQHFSDDIFKRISETADELGLECYVVGGYVRDIFLQRPSKDIDVVVVGSGIEMAEALGKRLGRGAHVALFKNFGTAQVKYRDIEVEFVGARKESYQRDSRKPRRYIGRRSESAGFYYQCIGCLPESEPVRRIGRPLWWYRRSERKNNPYSS